MRGRVCLLKSLDYLSGAFGLVPDHAVQAKKRAAKMQIVLALVRIYPKSAQRLFYIRLCVLYD